MSRFSIYKEFENPGFGLWIWAGVLDDFRFSVPELAAKHNHKRKRKLLIRITLIKWCVELEIPFKHIGDDKKKKRKNFLD